MLFLVGEPKAHREGRCDFIVPKTLTTELNGVNLDLSNAPRVRQQDEAAFLATVKKLQITILSCQSVLDFIRELTERDPEDARRSKPMR
ncbi:hypothetical protein GCK32_020551 [Trichostrongylus colubriformis]|uniref:Uncharacterized protein n=1 Tax=Trichostrongylus colubriformis TaxID=6319 RepID=A0AAN8FD03_TRICO